MQIERWLHFPTDRNLGILKILKPHQTSGAPGTDSYVPGVPATGNIPVPIGDVVWLHLRYYDDQPHDLAPLSALRPDDLYHLSLDLPTPDSELRHVAHLTGLRRLFLSDTGTTDVGLRHVACLAGLDTLDLTYTDITDAGLPHLAQLTNLRQLHIGGVELTPASVAGLQRDLPNCRLRYDPPRNLGRPSTQT